MRGVGTLWQVALREIRERGRSKVYLITSALTILIVIALIVAPALFDPTTEEATIGSIGDGNEAILDTAVQLATADDEPDDLPSLSLETIVYDNRDDAVSALHTGQIGAVLIEGEEVLVENASSFSGDSTLIGTLQRAAAAVEIDRIIAREGETATDIIEILTNDPLEVTTVTGEDPFDESRTVIAYAGLILLYIAILLYGTWILTGVTEEKTNRVVEVLLSSVRPWQILGGKILGIGLLAIVQLLGTLLVAVVALRLTNAIDLPPVEAVMIVNLVVWFVLGFLIFAVLFGASGALVSRSEDAQAIAMPMTVAAVAGFFASIVALESPDDIVAVIGSFIPVTAPFVVPVRSALAAIPVWQYALATLVCIASLVAFTYIGGRIYAGGLLRFGSRVGFREAWRSAGE